MKRRLDWTAIKNALRLYSVELRSRGSSMSYGLKYHVVIGPDRNEAGVYASMGTAIIVHWIIRVGGGKVP